MTTQVQKLINHFAKAATITNVEAQAVFKMRALPRRISDLEEYYGYRFAREECRDSEGQRYVRYRMVRR